MIVRTIPERRRGRAGIFCQSWRELRCARPTNQALDPVLARARGLSYAAGKVVPPRSERERSRWAGRGRRTCRGAGVNRSGHGRAKTGNGPGPKTPEGIERCRRSPWRHGYYSWEAKAVRREARTRFEDCPPLDHDDRGNHEGKRWPSSLTMRSSNTCKAAVVVNDGVANRMKLKVEVYGPEQW